jgi:hypothetical protein
MTRAMPWLAVTLLLASCGGGEREAIRTRVTSYYDAVNRADMKAVQACYAESSRNEVGHVVDMAKGLFRGVGSRLDDQNRYEVKSISIERLEGETAVVVVRYARRGREREERLSLVKEGGAWKIRR